MAPTPIEHLVRDLSRVASASEVRRAARRCGAVQRRGIVDIHALLMTVVLGVSVRGRVSLAVPSRLPLPPEVEVISPPAPPSQAAAPVAQAGQGAPPAGA